ncbi:ADP-ribose pyrophosphatase YjhB (NUDIX family) [Dyadobacter jejuensis]|uniref:ADP-ribose pyrophosphatase YjhB (NUDIX family) n=1 Tax=Dyadobacter jejuensis TaxID=1082580 RepID=A0A316AIU4_9BACT|nr:NUDIX hydrolase [Dyadobacter jejuensis]PWJ56800.1 ADP-ribose pyrophosphatase YjhB (NUDIX family) [Dyadobacter jejuensis]
MRLDILKQYETQDKFLVAIDSIIFGFDGESLKLLLVKRGIENEKDTWSLMGGWVHQEESLQDAASRILYELTNLKDIYLEQLHTFGDPLRDPVQRTFSIAYFALINVEDYSQALSSDYEAQWFSLEELPTFLFDHAEMVDMAIQYLRYKASQHPIGFELLPEKFTIPQLQKLYEAIFGSELDKRNFSRKLLSTKLLIKLDEKQRGFSKKGAYFYKVDEEKYKKQFNTFLNFLPNSVL